MDKNTKQIYSLVRQATSPFKNNYGYEDIVQDCVVKIWSKRHLYDESVNFSTWAWKVAYNCAQDAIRSSYYKTNALTSTLSEWDNLYELTSDDDEIAVIEFLNFVDSLNIDKTFKTALKLKTIDNKLTHIDIAKMLGKTKRQVDKMFSTKLDYVWEVYNGTKS